jgi:hypothetical protein
VLNKVHGSKPHWLCIVTEIGKKFAYLSFFNTIFLSTECFLPGSAAVLPLFFIGQLSKIFNTIFLSTEFTDKKENKTFLIYKEIQMGSGAKSYMTNGLLIYGEKFAHFLKY